MSASFREKLLQSILNQPTAPFRERHVIHRVLQELGEAGVPHFQDPTGNIVIGAASAKEYRALLARKTPRGGEPLRVFIAHMDHPGFHGVRWSGDAELEVKWHGGTPTAHLEGAAVWLADEKGWAGRGLIGEARLLPSGRALQSGTVQLPEDVAHLLRKSTPDARKLFGGFAFRQAMWQEDELIYTKAADDLVGVFAIVSLALDHWGKASSSQKRPRKPAPKRRKSAPFIGLLTRAEEVGFIGAIAHFELGWLPRAKRDILCVSLETSRTLPGAEIGKGPIVRLGDRATVFDASALRVLTDLAARVLPEKHQRRIMDGGSCEATAATAYGLRSIGISVPLGNYHNQSFEGGPDSRGNLGPAPEFVHQGDVRGLLTLCHALLETGSPWSDAWSEKRGEFKKSLKDSAKLLKTL